jgi:hypothetical protein
MFFYVLPRYVPSMAEDDDIRELIGRMSAAQRHGFHVTPGALRIVLAALRFYLAGRTWLMKPHADPHDDAPRKKAEKYTGPPPTIAGSGASAAGARFGRLDRSRRAWERAAPHSI